MCALHDVIITVDKRKPEIIWELLFLQMTTLDMYAILESAFNSPV